MALKSLTIGPTQGTHKQQFMTMLALGGGVGTVYSVCLIMSDHTLA